MRFSRGLTFWGWRRGSRKVASVDGSLPKNRVKAVLVGTLWLQLALAHSVWAQELVIVSSHWEGIKREFERGFNRYRNVRGESLVTFRWLDIGGTSDILRYIRGEFVRTPDSIGIDLFFGGGTDPYIELAAAGFLRPCPLPDVVQSGLPSELRGFALRDSAGMWYAASLSSFGILYNKKVVEAMNLPVPATWRDVTVPAARSWVSFADPRKSGTAHAVVEIILQAYGWSDGWQVLRDIGRNARSFTSSSSQVPKEVAVGEAAFGFLIDSYGRDAVKQFGEVNIGYHIPVEHAPFTGDSIAILKGSPHWAIAEEFVAYVLSDEGQRLFLAKRGTAGGPTEFELGKLSVRPALYDAVGKDAALRERPFDGGADFRYKMELAARRYGVVNDLVGACVIDADLAHEPPCAESQCAGRDVPPITEEEALELAKSWRDPAIRQRSIAEWRTRCMPVYDRGRRWLVVGVIGSCVAVGYGMGLFRWKRI